MTDHDSNDDLEAQIREALGRRRPAPAAPQVTLRATVHPAPQPGAAPQSPAQPQTQAQPAQPQPAAAPPAAPQAAASGLVPDPSERLGAPVSSPPLRRPMADARRADPAGHPAQPPMGVPAGTPAPGGAPANPDGRQALSALLSRSASAQADPETQIPPMPGVQPLGRIGVQQQPADQAQAPKAPTRAPTHPFFAGRRHLWPMLIIPAFSIGVVVILFYFLIFELGGEGVVDIAPLIEAEQTPIKVRPEEEGGMQIPNQDKEIFDELAGETSPNSNVEQLIPPPEEPVVPTVAAPEAAAPTAASSDGEEPSIPTVSAPDPAATGDAESTAADAGASETAAETTEPAAEPAAETVAEPASEPAAEPTVVTETAALPAGAFRIQLAALRSEEDARAAWGAMQAKLPELAPLQLHIERIDLGANGVFYRVQGGPLATQDEASKLCARIATRGQDCLVVKP